MISGTTQAAISPYVGVSIGDEFKYEVTIFHLKSELNSTVYINTNPFGMEGNKIDMNVTDIVEEEQTNFFGFTSVNNTKIKTTESFAGKSFESGTFLDEWYDAYIFFTTYFKTFQLSFDPETYEFKEPEPYNDSTENYEGLIVFASTNKSFYEQLESEISAPPTLTPIKNEVNEDDPFKLEHELYDVAYWEEKNEFYLNVSLYSSNSGTTSSEVGWDYNIGTEFIIHIDTANGLVKDIDYSMHHYVAVGDNNSLMKARQAFKRIVSEGGGTPTITLPYNLITPTLILLSIVTVFAFKKRLNIKKK